MDRDNRLFRKRVYMLQNRRKYGKCLYYRETKYHANMPVDLYMMRNEQRFREGIHLIDREY